MFFNTENLALYSNLNCISYYKTYNKAPKIYTYGNVIESVNILNNFFDKLGVIKNETIGLIFGHSPVIIPLILSILNSGNSFSFIYGDDLLHLVKDCQRRQIQYILADSEINLDTISNEIINRESIKVLEHDIQFLKIATIENYSLETATNICYCITTSGSTGQAKYVRVPFQCIMPNIKSLIVKFQLSSSDTIALISPTTFDPFIVDIFMGLTVGANMVFLDNSLRLSHSILALFLFSNSECGATFMQCTPSYFKLFGIEQITRSILSDSSSLNTLVLGGEKFPLEMEVKSWNTRKKIYNIYGITEVSCWATIAKWDVNVETSLGDPIDHTTILVIRSGELYIGSTTRICILDNEPIDIISTNKPILRATGDLVEHRNGRYFFKGRRNDSIKRFGIKLNLPDTENMILHLTPKILELKLLFYNQAELVLFYKCKDSDVIKPEEIQGILSKNLKPYEIPSEIIKLDKFPLSHNGKLSNQMLADLYCRKYIKNLINSNACDLFLSEIKKLRINPINENKRKKIDIMDLSFSATGGNSFIALNIVMVIENRLGICAPKLITLLLDESKTIKDCLTYLNQLKPHSSKTALTTFYTKSITSTIISKMDLQKCVDSAPSINKIDNKTIISIGSHSGIILNIELPNNKVISKLQLPDRIESEIAMFNEKFGIVGCYDGIIYCYNIITGEVTWSFNSNGMIKCRALIVNNLILFGNYSAEFNFYCLDGVNGNLIYRRMIGTKSIISNPIDYYGNFCIICTLDGTCEVFNCLDGLSKWHIKVNSPIFSTPVVIDERYILIAEVEGIVHCLDKNGTELWNFKTDDNIFSSFGIETITETLYYIYFGCYNKKLYCLEYNTSYQTSILKWESIELKSSIYSTPKIIHLDLRYYILVVATVGIIYLFDSETVELCHQLAIPGELFSTPAVIHSNSSAIYDCNIAVGSRDNYLYLINFKSLNKK